MNVKTQLKRYRNREFILFLNDVVKIYSAYDLKELKLSDIVLSLENNIKKLSEVFTIAKQNENTEIIENADARRDAAIVGIRTVAVGFENHFKPELSNAASVIINRIDKYGSQISKLNLLAETQALNGVISDFETDNKAIDALKLLNISDWIPELKEANLLFNEMFLLRNKDIADQPDQNLSDARKESMPTILKLIENTDAFYKAFENKEYKAILDQMEALIEKYNATIPTPQPRPKKPDTDK